MNVMKVSYLFDVKALSILMDVKLCASENSTTIIENYRKLILIAL